MACLVDEMDQIEINLETVPEGISNHEEIPQISPKLSVEDEENIPCPKAALTFMEVKDIVAASYGENGKRCYKVSWKESWLYDDQLFDCDSLIRKFWRQQPNNVNKCVSLVKAGVKRIAAAQRPNKSKKSKSDDVTIIVMKEDESTTSDNVMPDNGGKEQGSVNGKLIDTWISSDSEKSKLINSSRRRDIMQCHVCGDTFDMVAAIKRHYVELHPDTKPFACDLCSKRFDRKENLSRHVRIHTGDRRYICNHCGKGYTDPSGLKKHVIAKHSDDLFSCDVCCTATFRSKELLNQHLSKHLAKIKDAINDNSTNVELSSLPHDNDEKELVLEINEIESENDEAVNLNQDNSMNELDEVVQIDHQQLINNTENEEQYAHVKKELTDAVAEIIINAAQHVDLQQQQQHQPHEHVDEQHIEEDILQLQHDDQFVIPVEITDQMTDPINIQSQQQQQHHHHQQQNLITQNKISEEHNMPISVSQQELQAISNLSGFISTSTI